MPPGAHMDIHTRSEQLSSAMNMKDQCNPCHKCRAEDGSAEIAGFVLAGGTSSRLGFDKAELIFEETGVSLLTKTARLLDAVIPGVCVCGREHGEFSSLPDDLPGKGPVGAITTALRHSGKACFILACDMPFMDERTLRLLLAAWTRRKKDTLVTAFVHQHTGQKENLVAIYEQGALRFLEPTLKADLLKIGLVIPEKFYNAVPVPSYAHDTFRNINYPDEFDEIQSMGIFRNLL